MTRLLRIALAAGFAAGCATQTPQEPVSDTGMIVGEAGDPRNRARVHTELASVHYARGNMAVALEELRIATAADPGYAQAHNVLGLVYTNLRENSLAEQSFERALRIAPNDPEVNHNYGWFLCETGRVAESIKFFLQAIRNPLYPTPWHSYTTAGICSLRMKNEKDAEEFFQRALRLEPDDSASLLQLGQIRYRQGSLEEARKLVTRHNKLVDATPESLWLALRVERKLGERVAESSYANQLRRRFPGSREYQQLQRGEYD